MATVLIRFGWLFGWLGVFDFYFLSDPGQQRSGGSGWSPGGGLETLQCARVSDPLPGGGRHLQHL